MISNPNKNHFFLDLAESGRCDQYLTGTGTEPDLKKMTGSTGTGFTVAHCCCANFRNMFEIELENRDFCKSLFLYSGR